MQYPTYESVCKKFESGSKMNSHEQEETLVFLVGGGRRRIMNLSSSTDGWDDAEWFTCKNVGTKMFRRALKRGYKPTACVMVAAVEANNTKALDMMKDLTFMADGEVLLDVAIEEDNYEAAKWVLENCKVSRKRQLLCSNIDILELLKKFGFEWDASTYVNAIEKQDLPTIKYLHKRGVPWLENKKLVRYGCCENMCGTICDYLAQAGNVEIFQWCLAHSLPFDKNCCKKASTVPMIKFLVKLGSLPTAKTWISCCGNLDAIIWLYSHGYEANSNEYFDCMYYGSREVKKWIKHYVIPQHQDS